MSVNVQSVTDPERFAKLQMYAERELYVFT